MTKRRAIRCLERMQSLSGMNHLPGPAKAQLNALRDGVSVTRILTEHNTDEIAAALHAEMPWMAPATDEVWHGLRRSAVRACRAYDLTRSCWWDRMISARDSGRVVWRVTLEGPRPKLMRPVNQQRFH